MPEATCRDLVWYERVVLVALLGMVVGMMVLSLLFEDVIDEASMVRVAYIQGHFVGIRQMECRIRDQTFPALTAARLTRTFEARDQITVDVTCEDLMAIEQGE